MARDWQKRFWSKVDIKGADDCWNWKASKSDQGYGRFGMTSKWVEYAHRVSAVLYYGGIPGDLYVLHLCNNSSCCNPRHLSLGSQAENVRYMWESGRGSEAVSCGEDHPAHKLTEDQVTQMLQMRREGHTQASLAKYFGINQTQVGRIIRGEAWRHIGGVGDGEAA
jgi:hypothetical protein